MKLSCEKKNSANGKIEVQISKATLDAKAAKIAGQIAKNVKVDGFRKGKVPANVVEKRYGEKIAEDARQEIISEALSKGLDELKIEGKDLVGQPLITKFERRHIIIIKKLRMENGKWKVENFCAFSVF